MNRELLASPLAWLQRFVPDVDVPPALAYERWWRERGQAISDAVDRAGTPHLRMFDELGRRVDEIQFPPDYYEALAQGYRAGVVWRAFEEPFSLLPSFVLGYITSYFDPGLYCPYTVSLSTAVPLYKYSDPEVKGRVLPRMLGRDADTWQGATWMTEAGGGSDLGAGVETRAEQQRDLSWRLNGDKHFCSNVGAEVAVVAARPVDAPAGVRGLRLFAVPRHRADGTLNYAVRRLKDKIATRSVPTGEVELRHSEAWLLGQSYRGVYLILEVLNVSRIANSIGSVALAQRAVADAVAFAGERVAFGQPIIEHPLLSVQCSDRLAALEAACALAWEAARTLDRVWLERPPHSDTYDLFRLLAHLAKYWTAEVAVQTAKWTIEVFGGVGTLGENRVERWLREAMILAIWEGTPHRQMLDGLEAMETRSAHRLLLEHLRARADAHELEEWSLRLEHFLAQDRADREASIEPLFSDLARFTGRVLARSVTTRAAAQPM
ncbi:MAG: acyl-CoA dehydrogenase family protein [Bacteroidales bacterium]